MARALRDALYDSRIEWPPGQNKWFVPINKLDSIITYDKVKTALGGTGQLRGEQEISSYARIVCTRAKRVFAVLLYVDQVESIFSLIDDGICDEDLPFTRCYRVSNGQFTLCRKSNQCHQKTDHRGCGIRAITNWPQHYRSDFSRDQWQVQVPIFQKTRDGSIPHYNLDGNVALPFIVDHELQSKKTVTSGYSHVWGVKIHPAHQDLYRLAHAPDDPPLLAIKRPYSHDPLDFQRETNMLGALAVKKHPHLIKLLATYKFNGSYHLVFPHAAFNLRGYWDRTTLPHWNRETFLWTLTQMCGIASGLNTIHNFEATVPLGSQPANQALQVPSGGQLRVAQSEEKFGRHGDIKPENILWFDDLEGFSEESILQIADMGLGRFHRLDSRSKVDPHTISGSPTYMPPEIALSLPVSRSYDIWSLACVFLEFVTWLLEGGSSIYQFASARGLLVSGGMSDKVIDDDTYFTVFTDDRGRKHAEVREGVKSWIARLRRNQRCSQMVSCLLDLVQNKMLVIDSKGRISAEQLVAKLSKIRDQARNDADFLLGQSRPEIGQLTGMKKPQQDIPQLLSQPNTLSDNRPLALNTNLAPNASPSTMLSPSITLNDRPVAAI